MTSWIEDEIDWLGMIGRVAHHAKVSPKEVARWSIPAIFAYSDVLAEITKETGGE